jgi:hypothetical protein
VTTTHPEDGPRWARCDDVLASRSGAGTVVVIGGARTALALGPAEHVVWTHAAEPATVPGLASACGLADAVVRDTLAVLSRRGIVREVG